MKLNMKWVWILLSVFLTFVVVLAVLPFLINLNKFRPQIQEAVSSQLNAKVDFASAQLTILTGLGVELKEVSIENTDEQFKGTKLLHVQELDLNLELLPLLHKGLVGSIKIKSPEILIAQNGERNNLASLAKKDSKTEEKQDQKGDGSNPLDGLLIKSLVISDANITYQDRTKGAASKPILIHNLNVNLKNLGFDKEMELDLSTSVSFEKDKVKVKGPLVLHVLSNTHMENANWDNTKFQGTFDFNKLDLNYKNIFVKSDKTPFQLSVIGNANPDRVQIDDMKFNLKNLLAKTAIVVKTKDNFDSNAKIALSTKHIEELKQFFPQYEKLLSKGDFSLDLRAQGPLKKWGAIQSDLNLQLNLLNSDFALVANTNSLQPMNSRFKLNSKSLSVGELIKPFVQKQKGKDEIDFDKIVVTNLSSAGQILDQKLVLNQLNMNVFSGNVSSTKIDANLKEETIPFDGNITTKNLNVKQIVELVQPGKESGIDGKFDLNSSYSGHAGKDQLSKTLNAKGNFLFHEGKLLGNRDLVSRSIDAVTETLLGVSIPSNPLGQASDTVLKQLNLKSDGPTNVANFKSDFEIKNGKLQLSKVAVNLLQTTVETTINGVKDTLKDGLKNNLENGAKKIKEDPKKFLKDTFGL